MKMRTLLLVAVAALAIPTVATAQAGSATANSPDTKAVMATLESMAKATIEKDVATLGRIYGDDVTYEHSSGLTETKEVVLKNIQGPSKAEFMKFTQTNIRVYGDVALAKGIRFFSATPSRKCWQPSRILG